MGRKKRIIHDLTNAIRLTVEYVGTDKLPAVDGWSWFDALKKYRPDLAMTFVEESAKKTSERVTEEASLFKSAAEAITQQEKIKDLETALNKDSHSVNFNYRKANSEEARVGRQCYGEFGCLTSRLHNHGPQCNTTCGVCHPEYNAPVSIVNKRAEILLEAEKLINGDRADTYGPPEISFGRIAKLLGAMGFEVVSRDENGAVHDYRPLDAVDVALALMQLKVSRIISSPNHKDSWVDAAGYAALGAEMALRRNDKE